MPAIASSAPASEDADRHGTVVTTTRARLQPLTPYVAPATLALPKPTGRREEEVVAVTTDQEPVEE